MHARAIRTWNLVVATSLGNALEGFDISVYAYFAVYLSRAFFPTSDPITSLLLTFGTFALTFLARPIGGVLLGTYADRYGRKASLLLSIAMMTIGTLAVGCMPTFDRTLLVIVARVVRGFSAGGEFGSSTARPHSWSSTCRASAALSQAGSLRARVSVRCSVPDLDCY